MMLRPFIALSLCLMSAATPALAGSLSCVGALSQIMTTASGDLRVVPSWRGDWVTLCNVITPWKGVSIDVCKRWHAQALAAQITQGGAQIDYPVTAVSSCGGMGTNGSADAPGSLTNN